MYIIKNNELNYYFKDGLRYCWFMSMLVFSIIMGLTIKLPFYFSILVPVIIWTLIGYFGFTSLDYDFYKRIGDKY